MNRRAYEPTNEQQTNQQAYNFGADEIEAILMNSQGKQYHAITTGCIFLMQITN